MRKAMKNEPQEDDLRKIYKRPPAVRADINKILEGGEIQVKSR